MASPFEQLRGLGQLHGAQVGDHALHLLCRCLAILLDLDRHSLLELSRTLPDGAKLGSRLIDFQSQ